MKKWHISRTLRVPLIYGCFSVLWVFFSDKLAFTMAPDLEKAGLYSTIKGLVFVILSTLLIYLLLKSDESKKEKLLNEIVAVQRSFNLLFEDNPQPMWIYDNKTLEIMAVNSSACKIYGYAAAEFRRLKITDIRKQEDIPLLMKSLQEHKDDLRQTGPWVHIRKDGEPLMVQVISHPLRSAGLDSTLVSIIDLTEQHRKQEELDTAMQQRDDFESFGYTASHDLKAHLRAIVGYSDILEKEFQTQLGAEGSKFIHYIHEAGVAMNEMLDDMMIISGISRKPLEFQALNISDIFTDIVRTLTLQEPERDLSIKIQPEMTTFADFGAVRMIAQNLVQNAWKYTRNKKKTVIEIGCFENESKETVFFVRDNGIGFDSEIADHLFQPFRRGHADSRIDGMGIGLSVVKRAVERHGGRVWAESQPGKGASFFFTLNNNS